MFVVAIGVLLRSNVKERRPGAITSSLEGDAREMFDVLVDNPMRLELCVKGDVGDGVIARNNNKSLKRGPSGGRTMGGDLLPGHHRGPAIGPR